MTDEAPLDGLSILVVEDDFYIASDEAAALQKAGARVIGPCRDLGDAAIASEAPDGAVIDINLGDGPSFALARDLGARGIPFVFVTGYDQAVVPAEFAGVERVEKPIREHDLIAALARACRVRA